MSIPEYVITLIGNDTVGKTSIVNRLKYGSYQSHYLYTKGADQVRLPHFKVGDNVVSLLIFDTGGHHIQRKIIHKFIDAADAVMIVYDITNEKSFIKLPDWVRMTKRRNAHDINENAKVPDAKILKDEEPVLMLVGNKTDLMEPEVRWKSKNRGSTTDVFEVITEDRLKQMAESNGINIYKEVSAKANVNIDLTFKLLVERVIDKRGLPQKKQDIVGKIEMPSWHKFCTCSIL